MAVSSESQKDFRDRRLTPERVVAAVSGLLQTKLALTGRDTRIVELALCGEVHDLLAQSGWLVLDEFTADIHNKGTKHKRFDLITYRTQDHSGPGVQPKRESVTHAYEIKVLNNRYRATDAFKAGLLLDAARLALFGQQFRNCDPVQLVVAGVGSLAAYVQDQKNAIATGLERWAPMWGAMRTVASIEAWRDLADDRGDRGYSKMKTGDDLASFASVLDSFRGVFSSDHSPRSASFPSSALSDGLQKSGAFKEPEDCAADLGGKDVKYDRGAVHLVKCPGQEHRPENIGADDYLVFAARARAL